MFVVVSVIEILEFNWKKIKNKNRAKREPGKDASKILSRAQPHHPPARVGGEAGHWTEQNCESLYYKYYTCFTRFSHFLPISLLFNMFSTLIVVEVKLSEI